MDLGLCGGVATWIDAWLEFVPSTECVASSSSRWSSIGRRRDRAGDAMSLIRLFKDQTATLVKLQDLNGCRGGRCGQRRGVCESMSILVSSLRSSLAWPTELAISSTDGFYQRPSLMTIARISALSFARLDSSSTTARGAYMSDASSMSMSAYKFCHFSHSFQ